MLLMHETILGLMNETVSRHMLITLPMLLLLLLLMYPMLTLETVQAVTHSRKYVGVLVSCWWFYRFLSDPDITCKDCGGCDLLAQMGSSIRFLFVDPTIL